VKKLSLVALLVLFSACKGQQEGEAIHATVKLAALSKESASCVLFEVRDVASKVPSHRTCLSRGGKDELQVAILKGVLPDQVELAARPYRDCTCKAGELTEQDVSALGAANGMYVAQTASFTKGTSFSPTVLELAKGTDDDADGYVSVAGGGADCNDSSTGAEVHPGHAEVCSDQADLNCDSKKGCEASSCGLNACIGPPTALALTLSATSVQSGTCTGGTVQVKDSKGSNAVVAAATTVTLAAAPTGGIAFYSDAACTTAAPSVMIAGGGGSASFFFSGQAVGTVTVSAASAGLTMATQNVQVTPGVGNQLVFTSPARSAVSAVCSQVVQVQSRDAQGNAANVTASTPITLSATPSTGFKFYSDASCATEVTTAQMAAGTSSASFYFKGTVAGSVSVTVTAAGLTGATQTEMIVAGPPKIVILTGPASTQAGVCSTQVTVTLQDAQNNPTTATAATTINLSATGKPLTFSPTGACGSTVSSVSIAVGAGTASFFYRGTQVGPATITAAAAGLTSGTLAVAITPGPATALVFSTTAQTVQAGNCSGVVTVQRQDAFGNPAPVSSDTQVGLVAAPPNEFQFFSAAGCTGSAVTAVTMPNGSSDANFYFKGIHLATEVVTATVGSISNTQSETINPATPSVLVLSPATQTVVAGTCAQVTLQIQDIYGNLSPVSPGQMMALSASPSPGFTFSTASNCSAPVATLNLNVSSGSSSAPFYVSGTAAVSVTVTATKAPFTNGTATVTVGPAAPSKVAFKTTAQTVVSRTCSAITTVELQDTFNNPTPVAGSTTIGLAGSGATTTFYSDMTCSTVVTSLTLTTGQSSGSFYFKDNSVAGETMTITASSASVTNGTQAQTITPQVPTELFITTNPQTVVAGACSGGVVTVQTRAQGNPTAYTTATVVTPSGTGLTFFSNSSCGTAAPTVTIAAGQSTANFYFKGSTAGAIVLTAHSGSLTDATQTETITPAAPTKSIFITPSMSPVAGTCSGIVTVQSLDAFDNVSPTPGNVTLTFNQAGPGDPNFKFFSDMSCTTMVSTLTLMAGQSTASFYYRGELARTLGLAVSGSYPSPAQSHTIRPDIARDLFFSSSTPAQTLLAGTCAKRTVERKDMFGNLAPDTSAATVTPSGSTLAEFFSDANCTAAAPTFSIDAGNTSADFYFKGYTGGDNANAAFALTVASPGLTSATQNGMIIPTVRTGTCIVPGGQKTKQCTITPVLANSNRALLVFQSTAQSTDGADTNVRCRLISLTQIGCDRAGNTGAANVQWSVAEFPNAVVTQHSTVPCTGATTNADFTTAAVVAQSFLMLSGERNANNQPSAVSRLAELTSTNQAQIRKPGDCTGGDNNSVQLVDYPGAMVQRGQASMSSGATTTTIGFSTVDLTRSILLYSYTFTGTGAKICDRAVRGELTDGITGTFSRGEGDAANCSGMAISGISWEVVQFPVGTVVQQFTQPLGAGVANMDITLPIPVEPSRTIVIAGGQWSSGAVHGEGTYSGGEVINEMRARATVTDATHVNLTRESSMASAKFTVFVVQLKP
jgi:hypothetical protein